MCSEDASQLGERHWNKIIPQRETSCSIHMKDDQTWHLKEEVCSVLVSFHGIEIFLISVGKVSKIQRDAMKEAEAIQQQTP